MSKNRKTKWVLGGLVGVVVIGSGIYMMQSAPKDNQDDEIATIHATQMDPLSESGVVKADHQQDVKVPEGAQVTLYINDGATVQAGDAIGLATDTEAQNEAQRKWSELQTQIANAQVQDDDTQYLQKEQREAQDEYNKATKTIVAPYDGMLSIDDQDTTNVKIAISSSTRYIDSSVTDYDYDRLSTGATVKVATNSGNVKTDEKITSISEIAKESGKVANYTFKTTAASNYRLGQQVTLKIAQDDVVLPKSAVQDKDGKKYIYVVDGGKAKKQAIKATQTGDTYAISTDDLSTDVKIVKNPGNKDLDGKKI